MQIPGFIGPSYTLRSINAAFQRSLNLYPEQNEMSPTKWVLNHTPGLKKLATLGSGPVRGMFRASNGNAYAVSGSTLYDITVPTAPASKGTVATSAGKVGMADTTTQLVIVDGTSGYVWDFTAHTLTKITAAGFPTASSIAFLDQYLLVNDENSGRFQFSALNDGTSWDALDVATAEGSPDNLIALAVDHREIILFGDVTTEVWFDSGDALNPFQRINGAFIEHGIAGKNLHSLLDNTRLWWSKDADGQAVAMRMNGYRGERVSTYAVERAVQGYGDISTGTSFAYQDSGHTFWQSNFPNANVSWVFDAATGMWHERSYQDATLGAEQRHRADCHIFHANKHIVGDYVNGNIYELDPATYSDDGANIKKQRVWPGVKVENKRVFYPKVEIDMETGVGPEVALMDGNGDPRSPQAMLRYSDDSGHTYSDEIWTDLGGVGEYSARARFTRLGSGRDRVFELTITDPVPVCLTAAYADVTQGDH